jgi:SAM-dependent methyltransferase
MLENYRQEIDLIEQSIRNLYDGSSELTIIEAGCGRKWLLNLVGINYRIIGIDLDEDALDIRVNEKKDLDEAIVADLQDFDLGERKVDVIYNSFVLEHVKNAELMMENFDKALKSGGLLILRLPDRNTVFGTITRLTPLWFHVFFKKYIQGRDKSGMPGFGPYPTYYKKIVSRDGIRDFCKSYGYEISEEYGSCSYLRQNNLRTKVVKFFSVIVSMLSLGKLPWYYNNLTYVLTKTDAHAERV